MLYSHYNWIRICSSIYIQFSYYYNLHFRPTDMHICILIFATVFAFLHHSLLSLFRHQSYLTLCDPIDCSMPSFTVLHYPPEFAQIHVHCWKKSTPVFLTGESYGRRRLVGYSSQGHKEFDCCPLLLFHSIFPSTRVFFNELALHIWCPKHWSCTISPCNGYSGLLSFRIEWLIALLTKGLSTIFFSTTV